MNYIVTLYLLSTIFNQQISACDPYRSKEDTIDTDTVTIRKLRKFITGLKANYEEELIDIKMRETRKIYQIMFKTSRLVKNEMIDVREMGQNIRKCYNSFRYNLTKISLAATYRQRKCIENNINILKPVEEDIEHFLDDIKSCLLNFDLVRAQACLVNEAQRWEECNNEDYHSALTNGKKYNFTCDEENFSTRQMELEKSALAFRRFGLMYVTDCLLPLETEYNSSIYVMSNFGIDCVKNIGRQ